MCKLCTSSRNRKASSTMQTVSLQVCPLMWLAMSFRIHSRQCTSLRDGYIHLYLHPLTTVCQQATRSMENTEETGQSCSCFECPWIRNDIGTAPLMGQTTHFRPLLSYYYLQIYQHRKTFIASECFTGCSQLFLWLPGSHRERSDS